MWNKPGNPPKSSDSQPSGQLTVSWPCLPTFFLLPWALPALPFHIRIQSWVGLGALGFTGISGIQVMEQALPFLYYCLHWISTPELPSQRSSVRGEGALLTPRLTPPSHFLQSVPVGWRGQMQTQHSRRATATGGNLAKAWGQTQISSFLPGVNRAWEVGGENTVAAVSQSQPVRSSLTSARQGLRLYKGVRTPPYTPAPIP